MILSAEPGSAPLPQFGEDLTGGKPPVLSLLLDEACQYYGLDRRTILSERRGYNTNARRAIQFVLSETLGWSNRQIARTFDQTHAAVNRGLLRAHELRRTSSLFFEICERLKEIAEC